MAAVGGDLGPYGLALASAVVHAGWNVALARGRGAGPGVARSAAATATGVLVLTPFAVATWRIDAAGLAWAAASALAEVVYFVLLGRAYRCASVSRTYPVARGVAPVVVLVVTVLVTGTLLPLEVAAVGLVAWECCSSPERAARPDGTVLRLALPVSVAIATYTLLDARGRAARLAGLLPVGDDGAGGAGPHGLERRRGEGHPQRREASCVRR